MTRSSTSSNSARLFGPALVFGVAGSPSLALSSARRRLLAPGRTLLLNLNVGCTPGCLLLRTFATLALAVAVLAPLSLAFAVAALASERARVDGTRSESALRAPPSRSCDYVYVHTGRFQFETKRPICAIFSWLI